MYWCNLFSAWALAARSKYQIRWQLSSNIKLVGETLFIATVGVAHHLVVVPNTSCWLLNIMFDHVFGELTTSENNNMHEKHSAASNGLSHRPKSLAIRQEIHLRLVIHPSISWPADTGHNMVPHVVCIEGSLKILPLLYTSAQQAIKVAPVFVRRLMIHIKNLLL